MTDFGLRHRGTAPPGGAAWMLGRGFGTSDRPRSMICIDDDGWRYFYQVRRAEIGEFRRWAAGAFLAKDGRDRIAGRYPSYSVVNRPQY